MAQKASTQARSQDFHGSYPPSPFRLFEDFFNDWALNAAHVNRSEEWRPPVDILEKDGTLFLRIELAGMSEKDINLKLEGNVLTVKGERKSEEGCTYRLTERNLGTFSRSFTLPDSADTDHLDANYKNGILTISVPQRPEVRTREIKVNT